MILKVQIQSKISTKFTPRFHSRHNNRISQYADARSDIHLSKCRNLKEDAISRVQRHDEVNSARNFGISKASKALNVGHKQIPVKLHIITLDISFSVIVTIILPWPSSWL